MLFVSLTGDAGSVRPSFPAGFICFRVELPKRHSNSYLFIFVYFNILVKNRNLLLITNMSGGPAQRTEVVILFTTMPCLDAPSIKV